MSAPHYLVIMLATIMTVAFLVSGKSRARVRFSYGESSSRKTTEMRGDGFYLIHESIGVVRNCSTEASSLETLRLVSWWPNRNAAALFTGNPEEIMEAGVRVSLPMRFEEKSSHTFTLRWEVRICSSSDLVQCQSFEVALQESDGRLFNRHGQLKNRRKIELLQRFIKDMGAASDGEMPSLAKTFMKLKMHEITFALQWMLWRIGF